jgi:hypothetical protein
VVETRSQFARRLLHNARVEIGQLQQIVGTFLLVVLILGCCAELIRRDGRLTAAVPSLIVLALPLAYMPVFYIEPRYVYPASVPVLMFGVWQVLKRFSGEGTEFANSRRSIPMLLPLMLVPAFSFVQPDIALVRGPRADDSPGKIGVWLQEQVKPGQAIMSNDAVTAFYAGRRRFALPHADLAGTIEAADRSKVDYLVLSSSDYLTPEMAAILNGSKTSEQLRRAGEWSDGADRRVVLFRLSRR